MPKTSMDSARETFIGGFNCAQAVCSTFAEQLGLERRVTLKMAGAFGGGMAGTASTCGAVTGGLMVIGLKYGKCEPDDDDARQRCTEKAQMFLARFTAKHGALTCRELLGCDISTPEGREYQTENQLKEKRCVGFVTDAVGILEEIL